MKMCYSFFVLTMSQGNLCLHRNSFAQNTNYYEGELCKNEKETIDFSEIGRAHV